MKPPPALCCCLVLLLGAAACEDAGRPGGLWSPDQGPRDRGLAEGPWDLAAPDVRPLDAPASRPDGPSTQGGPCTGDGDCTSGLSCDKTLPGGMCTRTCASDADCGGARWGCYNSRCTDRCNPRSILPDCRSQYVCRLEGTAAFCVAHCATAGCSGALACDAKSGLCLDPKGGTLGDACGLSIGNCDGTPNGVCLALTSMSKPFCTLPCSPFTKPCPKELSGSSCQMGGASGEYCVFTCDPKAPKCPNANMKCVSITSSYSLCLPS